MERHFIFFEFFYHPDLICLYEGVSENQQIWAYVLYGWSLPIMLGK